MPIAQPRISNGNFEGRHRQPVLELVPLLERAVPQPLVCYDEQLFWRPACQLQRWLDFEIPDTQAPIIRLPHKVFRFKVKSRVLPALGAKWPVEGVKQSSATF
jgi:hypothetical protein